jgi:predicted amidohydrolase YtcJ
MPRYVIERTFPTGLKLPTTPEGAAIARRLVRHNDEKGVTWIHSYVTLDKTRTFCVYDAPSPEAIREVALKNELPVNNITEVSVLDPYFYH